MGGHRRDAAPRQAPRPSWWLPATTISEQTRSPGPVCVSVRAAAAAARVRENVHSDSIAHGERARHREREYRGRGGPAAPRPAPPRGHRPAGRCQQPPAASTLPRLSIYSELIIFLTSPQHGSPAPWRLRASLAKPVSLL